LAEDNDFFRFFEGYFKPPKREKPGEGEQVPDPNIRLATQSILKIKHPTTIVDYGCGEGRLIQSMNLVSSKVLKLIDYVGVDVDSKALNSTKQLAMEIKFDKKVNSFSVMTPKQFYSSDLNANMVFLIDVLHEIHLINLPVTIYTFTLKMKRGDIVLIYDLLQLPEGEKIISAWYPESLSAIFEGIGFDARFYTYKTNRGYRISTYAEYVDPKKNRMSFILNLCLESYRISKKLLKQDEAEESNSGKRSARMAYLIAAYNSMVSQMDDFDKWFCGQIIERPKLLSRETLKLSTDLITQGFLNEIRACIQSNINSAFDWLMKNRTHEGVWGYCEGGPARMLNTCEVLVGMLNAGVFKLTNHKIKIALNWIVDKKCSDGGFPSFSYTKILRRCPSTTECTSWALYLFTRLAKIGFPINKKVIADAAEWLKMNFDEDKGGWGSWKGDPIRLYPTLWALRALNATKALDMNEYDYHLKRLIELESENIGCFGFSPNTTPSVSMTALFLILISELPKQAIDNLWHILHDRIKSAKEFIFLKQEKENGLWIEEEEIRFHTSIRDEFGEPLKTPFHHFSTAWALQALLSIKLSMSERLRLYRAATCFIHLQETNKGYVTSVSKSPHLEKAFFLTALGLNVLGSLRTKKEIQVISPTALVATPTAFEAQTRNGIP
jgi:hypothetical protein